MEKKEPPKKRVTSKSRIAEKRKNRVPIEGRQQKLAMKIPDGFVGRWFNDVGTRIQQAKEAGYEFLDSQTVDVVTEGVDMGSVVRQRVDRKLTNEPVYAYLMVIEKELYDEDQAKKLEAIISTERKVVKGDDVRQGVDGDLVYVKEAKIGADSPM